MKHVFLPRNNQIYALLVRTRPIYRYCCTGFVALGITYSWFYWIYQPLQENLRRQEQELVNIVQRNEAGRQAHAVVNTLETTVATLTKALQNYKNTSESTDGSFPITTLVTLLEKYNLSLQHCHVETPVDYGWYTHYPVTVEAQGTIDTIIKMLTTSKTTSFPLYPLNLTFTHVSHDIFKMTGTLAVVAVK